MRGGGSPALGLPHLDPAAQQPSSAWIAATAADSVAPCAAVSLSFFPVSAAIFAARSASFWQAFDGGPSTTAFAAWRVFSDSAVRLGLLQAHPVDRRQELDEVVDRRRLRRHRGDAHESAAPTAFAASRSCTASA